LIFKWLVIILLILFTVQYSLRKYILCCFCCLDDAPVDDLPKSECVDTKPSDQSPIPHMDLDNSEISLDVNAIYGCDISASADSPKSEGMFFPLSVLLIINHI